MKINTAAVLGAGAIGSYFIWGLSDKLADNFCVIAKDERKERLERDGIQINDKVYCPVVKTPKEARGVDLLLIATKYGALENIVSDVATICDSHTIVLSLLNGVDSEEILARSIDASQIVYSFMKIAAERHGHSIAFDPEVTQGLFYGEANQKEPSERMLAIKELFVDTPLKCHMCEDIVTEIWKKFTLNISYNLAQAIIGCSVGAYYDSEHVAWISRKLREEVCEIAAAKGVTIQSDKDPLAGVIVNPKSRYSTLQDLDAHRHTEIDMFSGTMVRMGRELSIPTPYNEMVYHLIKALEEKNDGRFNY
jgi:2-dehydropantoate 2-reductase